MEELNNVYVINFDTIQSMSDLINVLGLAFLGSVLALVGGVAFLLKKDWSEWLSSYSVPFAAGVLLTISLLGLLPEAVDMYGEGAFGVALLTFLVAYLFEHFFFCIHHHDHDCKHGLRYKAAIPMVIVGDTIHNFIDGVAIAATYMVSPGLGLVTTISTFLHEVPHEIGDFGILLGAGWRRKKILLVNVLSALATIVGALVVWFWIEDPALIGMLLAVSAGLFLYLGASDFLPNIHQGKISEKKAIAALIIGVLVMFLTIKLTPHSHGEDDHNHAEEKQIVVE
jgi:zinc and cadmium transporter